MEKHNAQVLPVVHIRRGDNKGTKNTKREILVMTTGNQGNGKTRKREKKGKRENGKSKEKGKTRKTQKQKKEQKHNAQVFLHVDRNSRRKIEAMEKHNAQVFLVVHVRRDSKRTKNTKRKSWLQKDTNIDVSKIELVWFYSINSKEPSQVIWIWNWDH